MNQTTLQEGPARPDKLYSAGARASELWQAVWSFKYEFAMAGGLSAVANLLMLTPTLYMLQVYDRVMVSRNEWTLLSLSMIALAMFGLMAIAEWGRSRVLVALGMRFDQRLAPRVFETSFESQLSTVGRQTDISSRSFSDLLQVRQFLTGNGIFAFFDLPWVPIYIAVMFLLHPMLGWLSIGFAFVQGVLAWAGHRKAVAPAQAAHDSHQEVLHFLQGKLRHAEVMEAMGMVRPMKAHWARRHSAWMGDSQRSQELNHRVTAVSKFVRYTQQSLSLGAGALLVINGELSPGAMIAANVLMTRALAPIDMLVSTWRGFIAARESFMRLGLLLAAHPPQPPAPHAPPKSGGVSLREVWAEAPARSQPILRGVSLDLSAGQVLVVMGASGSGKSTLARVMLGVWPDVSGEVLIDGRAVVGQDRMTLGPTIGYLPQDIELFDGTVAENIARFGPVNADRVIEAARCAGLHDMILRLPKGYDTVIGEGGGTLSGGQRQRVALARALYGSPVLVVLDEPNANLDDVGEAALASAVRQLRQRGSSVVLVSHRTSAVALADRLLILEAGSVRIEGPRDQVLEALKTRTAAAAPASPTTLAASG